MTSPENTTSEQHRPRGMLLHPQTNQLSGKTFASTLLLSLSCAPLLKQHLLKNLQVTNEEFNSLQPMIEEAYNNWDYQVYVCYLCFMSNLLSIQRRLHAAQSYADPIAEGQHSPHLLVDHESSIPQRQQLDGHTFASTLFQCFSCAPLLKQHTLGLLQLVNEELYSIEPVIAEAYNSWNYQRGLHPAQRSADAAQSSDIQPSL